MNDSTDQDRSQMLAKHAEALKSIAAISLDPCVVATYIAVSDNRVAATIVSKLQDYVWKGSFCKARPDGKIAVVFNFACKPDMFCLVAPWFAAIVDVELSVVVGIQDPYQPPVRSRSRSSCGCSNRNVGRSLECQICENVTGYDELVDALSKAKDRGKFDDKSGCRDFVDDAAFKAFLANELLLGEPVVDLIVAAAQGCGHCACNNDVF